MSLRAEQVKQKRASAWRHALEVHTAAAHLVPWAHSRALGLFISKPLVDALIPTRNPNSVIAPP